MVAFSCGHYFSRVPDTEQKTIIIEPQGKQGKLYSYHAAEPIASNYTLLPMIADTSIPIDAFPNPSNFVSATINCETASVNWLFDDTDAFGSLLDSYAWGIS